MRLLQIHRFENVVMLAAVRKHGDLPEDLDCSNLAGEGSLAEEDNHRNWTITIGSAGAF